jgi:YtcA family
MEQANLPAIALTRRVSTAATLTLVGLSGCDPVVSVAGADFPDWLACVIAGCLLCAASHLLFRRTGLERHLRPLPFFYGSLILMFSLIIWVTFFNRV